MKKQSFRVILRVETEADRTITEAGLKRLLQKAIDPDKCADELWLAQVRDVLETTGQKK